MNKKRNRVAVIALLLAVVVMGLVGTAGLAFAGKLYYIECHSCDSNSQCGWPNTGMRCLDGTCRTLLSVC